MSRYTFGGGNSDFAFATTPSGNGSYIVSRPVVLTLWSAQTGGTRYTDLLDSVGAATTTITATSEGRIPVFSGPDGVTQMWLDGGSTRALITTSNLSAIGGSPLAAADSTGSVDIGTLLQAAFDANPSVQLPAGGTFLLNTPIFLDSTNKDTGYRLDLNGSTLLLGSGLPSASAMGGLTGTKFAFFPNTLRAALSAGTVTTDVAHAAAGSALPPSPKFVIQNGKVDAGSNIVGISFGNQASTHIRDLRGKNVQCWISWVGYVDENKIENSQTIGSNPTGSGSSTRMIFQRDSGDSTTLENCKAFGGVLLDAAGAQGFKVDSCVSGQVLVNQCKGVILDPHIETDEISSLPYSVSMDRSEVLVLSGRNNSPKSTARTVFYINDAASTTGSVLTLMEHADVFYFRPSSPTDAGDPARGPLVNINALNDNGAVRFRGVRSLLNNGWTADGVLYPEGPLLASADSGITAALAGAGDTLATDFDLRKHRGNWAVTPPDGLSAPTRTVTAPTLAAAADSDIPGALTASTAYQYVAAIKTAAGGYTALSSAVTATTNANKTVALTLTNIPGPCTVAVWRATTSGVTTAPDHYIEIPIKGTTTKWWDTGTNINGRLWATSSLPVPNTVASTAAALTTVSDPAGALAATFDRRSLAAASSAAMTSGTGLMCVIELRRGGWVSTVNYRSGGSGATTPTHQWAAIKSLAGKVLAVTADATTTAIAANTTYSLALSATTFLAPGLYYVELMVTATTGPQVQASSGGSSTLSGLPPILSGTDPTTGRTTPPTLGAFDSVPSAASAVMPYFWLT